MPTIRAATEKDEKAVFLLAGQLSSNFKVEGAAFSDSFAQLLAAEDVYLHVVEKSGELIAYLLGWSRLAFYSNGAVAWIQEIVVRPESRRAGIGESIMTHFERWSANRSARVISLATRGATDFYLALDYTESATYYKKTIQPNQITTDNSGASPQ